jgi:predicted nucleic acid-binding protein
MVKEICLDTGVITLFFMKNPPPEISDLFNSFIAKTFLPHILPPVMIEAYKHFTLARNKAFAQQCINTFLETYPHVLVQFDKALILKTGELKVDFSSELSYVDASLIAYALLNKMELHTTEKDFPEIPRLKAIQYRF